MTTAARIILAVMEASVLIVKLVSPVFAVDRSREKHARYVSIFPPLCEVVTLGCKSVISANYGPLKEHFSLS